MIAGHKTLSLTYDYSKQYLPLQRSKDVQEVKKPNFYWSLNATHSGECLSGLPDKGRVIIYLCLKNNTEVVLGEGVGLGNRGGKGCGSSDRNGQQGRWEQTGREHRQQVIKYEE